MKLPKKKTILHNVREEIFLNFTKMEFCETAIAEKGNDRHNRKNHVINSNRLNSTRFDKFLILTRLDLTRFNSSQVNFNYNSTRLDSLGALNFGYINVD